MKGLVNKWSSYPWNYSYASDSKLCLWMGIPNIYKCAFNTWQQWQLIVRKGIVYWIHGTRITLCAKIMFLITVKQIVYSGKIKTWKYLMHRNINTNLNETLSHTYQIKSLKSHYVGEGVGRVKKYSSILFVGI